jgi:predicted membrane channel-forming protein YqfA (hemolysin III family)
VVKRFKVSQTNTYFAINPEERQDAYIHLVGAILLLSNNIIYYIIEVVTSTPLTYLDLSANSIEIRLGP